MSFAIDANVLLVAANQRDSRNPEAAAALSRMALARRGVFELGGGQLRRQLAVVRALTSAQTTAAKQALARIAAEGEGEVAQAAAAVLGARSGSAG